jgi:bifunctional non-homologous end joining protein LigD
MHVEDHPVDYGGFEGIIPAGEYGGGTDMLWDRGTWEPVGDPDEGYHTGRFKFRLHGEKLRGRWMLVHTARGSSERDLRQWLLFKERDEEARPAANGDVLQELPRSVATDRTLEEIAADRDRVWSADANTATEAKAPRTKRATRSKRPSKAAKGQNQLADLHLSHPNKVFYPEAGITKLELAGYYHAIADWMLPHLAGRPLVLVRCPEGHARSCFYQKHPPPGTLDHLRRIAVREKEGTEEYAIIDDVAGLVSLAQVGALEIHAWGSRADKLERPDRLIFDLDPDTAVPWSRVVESARQVHEFLGELGLKSFVKTTGGKGLHLVVPIDRRHDWEEVKSFCKMVAEAIVAAAPARYTANMAKAARPGKIFVDYLRNGRGSTAVVPYSPRARPNAPVSMPLTWKELTPAIGPAQYTIRNALARLNALKRDPWADLESVRQGLAGPLKKLRAVFRS